MFPFQAHARAHTLTGSGSRPPCLCAPKSWRIHPAACRCVSDKPCTPGKMSQNMAEIQRQESDGSKTTENKQVSKSFWIILLRNLPLPRSPTAFCPCHPNLKKLGSSHLLPTTLSVLKCTLAFQFLPFLRNTSLSCRAASKISEIPHCWGRNLTFYPERHAEQQNLMCSPLLLLLRQRRLASAAVTPDPFTQSRQWPRCPEAVTARLSQSLPMIAMILHYVL